MRLRFLFLSPLLFLLAAGCTTGRTFLAEEGQVVQLRHDMKGGAVYDGDTVRVTGLDKSVRLIAIDAEEVFRDDADRLACADDWEAYVRAKRADSPKPVKFPTPAGEAAREWAKRFFEGIDDVLFVHDDEFRRRGYYDRHLGHLLVDRDGDGRFEENFAVEIVRAGHSPYFVKYGRSVLFDEEFREAEAEARAAGRGIWSDDADAPKHYPDYDERLVWWHRRADALERFRATEAGDPTCFELGQPEELERLQALAESQPGAEVVLFGSIVPRVEKSHPTVLAYVAHRNRSDVPLEWIDQTPAAVRPLEIAELEGEYLYARGRIFPSPSRTKVALRIESAGDLTTR